jgi:hypothetical protein
VRRHRVGVNHRPLPVFATWPGGVIELTPPELKMAISEQRESRKTSQKDRDSESVTPQEGTATPENIASNLEIYYDAVGTTFWVQNNRAGWIKVKAEDVKARLAKLGHRRKTQEGEQVSPVDLLMIEIQASRDVDYAGSLAGFAKGVYMINEKRILVKDSPRLLTSAPGDWPLLRGIILNMLGPEQQDYLLGWLKVSLESLYSGKHRVGQALVLAGQKDCGKSLLQDLITILLGNRSHKSHRYMNGETTFNGELFGAEYLMIEDEEAATDIRARRNFGTKIKEITANRTLISIRLFPFLEFVGMRD